MTTSFLKNMRGLKNTMLPDNGIRGYRIMTPYRTMKIVLFLTLFLPAAAVFFPATSLALQTCTSGYVLWNNLDKSQYVEMISPDQDNMRVAVISLNSSYAMNFRMALYLDPGGVDPVGAVKIYDSGPLNHPGGGNRAFRLETPVDLPKNTTYGLAVKWDPPPGTYTLVGCTNPAAGYTFYNNEVNESSAAGNSQIPFQETITTLPSAPADEYPYSLVIGHKPVITHVTTPIAGTSATITGTGFDKGISGIAHYVWLTENNDWNNPGVKVLQPIIQEQGIPTSTTIEFTKNDCGLYSVISGNGNKAYLWVEDAGGLPDTGYEVTITSYSDSTPPTSYFSASVFPAMEVTPDTGTHVPDTLTTMKDSFRDRESPISRCEYTIDGGLTWNAAALQYMPLSEAGRCTTDNLPVGADGTALTIQMRAQSCGGWSIPTRTLHRTVDSAGPVNGSSFDAIPGVGECSLAWSATTDNASGMNTSAPYWVTSQADAPPTDCTNPSQRIYAGTDTSLSHTNLTPGKTYFYKLCYHDALGNLSEYSGNPISCTLGGISIGDGVAPPALNWIKKSDTNRTVSTFTLSSHPSPDTVTELRVTGTNTANISTVKIFKDNGTAANVYDSNDTFVAAAPFSGTQAVFSGLNLAVSTTAEQYLITFDTTAAPAMLETVTAYVSAATGGVPVISYDTPDAAPKIDSQDPVTVPTFTVPSAWQSTEITITLSRNDGSGSGFPPVNTSLWGCFGTGCTPALLSTNAMTSNCGAGNTCTYDLRYYSMDLAGNVEQVKTNATQVRIDRAPPAGGTFLAYENSNPVVLEWNGFTDAGSAISAYRLMRADGPTPPADCASGSQRYYGSSTAHTDSGTTNGQQYSYRLCVYDAVGNISSNNVATVTAGEPCSPAIMCDSCHGPNWNTMGGSRTFPPRGHALHGPECGRCHREGADPAHVDGIVTISPMSGYQGGDTPWPGGGGGMSCGGPWNPVGGDPGGGMMGCHTMGTPNYPGLTPEWECAWEEFPICNPPPGP